MALRAWKHLTSESVCHYHDENMRNDMTALSVPRYDKNKLRKWFHKWFGTNRGTHWTIAGSVAVIIFGGYLVYNGRNSNPSTIIIIPAAERTTSPIAPGPFPLKR
jgi:hypothetical protein